MKLAYSMASLVTVTLLSGNALAGVYKCTDKLGKVAYQAAPCAEANNALKMDLKTGGSTDVAAKKKQQDDEKALKKRQEVDRQKKQQALKIKEAQRKKDAIEQSAINQQLIKDNPVQYSAFAIPPYQHDKLSAIVKPFEARLPDIEKFRRLAAQKALATGKCQRVEADELTVTSQIDKLVFSVDCSTANNFQFTEAELLK